MPIVRIALAVSEMSPGDELSVEATDCAFELDVRAWARMTGNELKDFEPGEVQRATIRVA